MTKPISIICGQLQTLSGLISRTPHICSPSIQKNGRKSLLKKTYDADAIKKYPLP